MRLRLLDPTGLGSLLSYSNPIATFKEVSESPKKGHNVAADGCRHRTAAGYVACQVVRERGWNRRARLEYIFAQPNKNVHELSSVLYHVLTVLPPDGVEEGEGDCTRNP